MSNLLMGVDLPILSKDDTLEKILKYINNPSGHMHVISINPEIFIICDKNPKFKKVIKWSSVKIIDGIGVVLAAKLLNIPHGARFTGVDLMQNLIVKAHENRFRIMLIGGGPKVAENAADCQSNKYPEAMIFGIQGIKDINNPTQEEEREIFSIVSDRKPHIVFVAFGSPEQELWLYENRAKFEGSVCIGVGGAFDFLSGSVARAPIFVRRIGLEWLFRLIIQPWRWRRQLRLIKFWYLVLKQYSHKKK